MNFKHTTIMAMVMVFALASSAHAKSKKQKQREKEEAAEEARVLKLLTIKPEGKQPTIVKMGKVVEVVDNLTREPENLSSNDDGTKLVWVAGGRKEKMPLLFPVRGWHAEKIDGVWLEAEKARRQFLHFYHGMAYGGENSEIIAVGSIARFFNIIRLYDQDFKKIDTFHPKDFGIEKNILLKHAQVSPDGKWLTFYTRGIYEKRGVMVYNLETEKAYHLGAFDDKHPTWTPDGKKILVHFQRGGNSSMTTESGQEEAFIAFYNLEISGNELVSFNRETMDDTATEYYTYQKHPSVTADGKYLFYHSKKTPFERSHIHVRRFEPGSTEYSLRFTTMGGNEIKKSKHLTEAKKTKDIFFVGKERKTQTEKDAKKEVEKFDAIYQVPDARITELFESLTRNR
ncbi:MAG: hypothetical protein HOE90_12500 [Bacteriovoracaceae bacterium]|jgi:hypothetical protein|nr:hypothetical protein [Bacteriovoracaceae bacterium]